MLDVIMIVCIIIMAISGIACQFLPADKLVKKKTKNLLYRVNKIKV